MCNEKEAFEKLCNHQLARQEYEKSAKEDAEENGLTLEEEMEFWTFEQWIQDYIDEYGRYAYTILSERWEKENKFKIVK